MNHILFLDFDGVINQGFGRWHRDLVLRLNEITDETGAKIVIHSSWRYGRTLPTLRHVLSSPDLHLKPPPVVTGEILDVCDTPVWRRTPGGIWVDDDEWASFKGDIATDHERAIAIQRWLDVHGDTVERYIILDDSLKLGHFVGTPEFINTETRVGLTKKHVRQAVQHLQGGTRKA